MTAEALKKEILRREQVKRMRRLLYENHYVEMAARKASYWLYCRSRVEYDAGRYEVGDWYHKQGNIVGRVVEDCEAVTSDLYQRFQRDLIEDINYIRNHTDWSLGI